MRILTLSLFAVVLFQNFNSIFVCRRSVSEYFNSIFVSRVQWGSERKKAGLISAILTVDSQRKVFLCRLSSRKHVLVKRSARHFSTLVARQLRGESAHVALVTVAAGNATPGVGWRRVDVNR